MKPGTDFMVDQLMDSIQGQAQRTIDTFAGFSEQPRELVCIEVGKALMLLASSFLGNAIGLDAETGLQPGIECIAKYKALAETARKRIG